MPICCDLQSVVVMQCVSVESEGVGAGASRPDSVPLILLADGEETPPQNCHRLVLLGSAKVGKTAIVSRFLNNKYDDKYTPTIEDFHRKVYRIRRESYRLDILDTSGNNPFPAMKPLSLLTRRCPHIDTDTHTFACTPTHRHKQKFADIAKRHPSIVNTNIHAKQACVCISMSIIHSIRV